MMLMPIVRIMPMMISIASMLPTTIITTTVAIRLQVCCHLHIHIPKATNIRQWGPLWYVVVHMYITIHVHYRVAHPRRADVGGGGMRVCAAAVSHFSAHLAYLRGRTKAARQRRRGGPGMQKACRFQWRRFNRILPPPRQLDFPTLVLKSTINPLCHIYS